MPTSLLRPAAPMRRFATCYSKIRPESRGRWDRGEPFMAEIKFVSPVTLRDLLGPFGRVDHLEADLQQSEILAFPPFIDLLHDEVRRGSGPTAPKVHSALHDSFISRGWEIVFSFAPNTGQETVLGAFNANDCSLTVLNPNLQSIGYGEPLAPAIG